MRWASWMKRPCATSLGGKIWAVADEVTSLEQSDALVVPKRAELGDWHFVVVNDG